jgi:hypothetical protein
VELARRYGRPLIVYLGREGSIDGLSRGELPEVAVGQGEVEAFIRRWLAG